MCRFELTSRPIVFSIGNQTLKVPPVKSDQHILLFVTLKVSYIYHKMYHKSHRRVNFLRRKQQQRTKNNKQTQYNISEAVRHSKQEFVFIPLDSTVTNYSNT